MVSLWVLMKSCKLQKSTKAQQLVPQSVVSVAVLQVEQLQAQLQVHSSDQSEQQSVVLQVVSQVVGLVLVSVRKSVVGLTAVLKKMHPHPQQL
ncbi:tape measure protein [Bacillus phage Tomato]|nr:tape measure protein [Bacillus phage Tomato]